MILRGSGETTAALARLAAENGVKALAHAEGGGVLYVHESADRDKLLAIAEASLDRLGVCNRLNLALVDRQGGAEDARGPRRGASGGWGSRCTGHLAHAPRRSSLPLEARLGHEWANDPDRSASVTIDVVDGLEEAVRLANEETSGLAAAIVAEDESAARSFLESYRGTAAVWNAPTRFVDGFELTGAPETGINVGREPGPRGPVTYRDLWLRQYWIVGDGSQRR